MRNTGPVPARKPPDVLQPEARGRRCMWRGRGVRTMKVWAVHHAMLEMVQGPQDAKRQAAKRMPVTGPPQRHLANLGIL